MKRIICACISFLLLSLVGVKAQQYTSKATKPAKKVRVYFLGGQSNMAGFGYVKELPKSFKVPQDVYIFHGQDQADGTTGGGQGYWEPLRPGHGTGFALQNGKNKLSDRFGIELSLAQALRERYPDDRIAFIKYARNGTGIDSLAAGDFGSWDPDYRRGDNQYDFCLQAIRQAFTHNDLDGDGQPEELVPAGICWMQGESDACFGEAVALRYREHLSQLMGLLRAALRDDGLSVVIGKISDSGKNERGKMWPHGELVQYAQEEFVVHDPHAAIVRQTARYGYSDVFHYDTQGFLDLGRCFAEALLALEDRD